MPTVALRATRALGLAGLLLASPLAAQSQFGQLQYAPPKGTRAESPAAVIFTDSSGSSLCRFGILPESRASGDLRADNRAAFAAIAQLLGGTGTPPSGAFESKMQSGHVQLVGETSLTGADGQKRSLRVITISGAGTQATAFVHYSSFLRCVLRFTAFENSLVPLWQVGGAVVAGGAPAGGGSAASAPSTTDASRTVASAQAQSQAQAQAQSAAQSQAQAQAQGRSGGGGITAPSGGAIGTRGWAYTSTQFSDGWKATIDEEWVVGRKGDVTVFLHHPREDLDAYMGYTRDEVIRAWNALVVPRYRDITGWVVESPSGAYPARAWGWAQATEVATGRRVFVAMAKLNEKGRRFIEVMTPDQATFEREFGSFAEGRVNWDGVFALQGMNRFPVALSDLAGEWNDRFAAHYDIRNINTGAYQGSYMAGYSTTLVVDGGSYRLTVAGGQGQLGSMRVGKQEDTGPVTLPDAWSIRFGNMTPGRRDLYWAHFQSIRGGRVLVMGTPGDNFESLKLVKVK